MDEIISAESISADIKSLKDQIAGIGMYAELQASLLTQLDALDGKVKAISAAGSADDTPLPPPAPPAPVTEPVEEKTIPATETPADGSAAE